MGRYIYRLSDPRLLMIFVLIEILSVGVILTTVPTVSADTRVGALALNTGENVLSAVAIDSAGGFAYFGTETSPGRVVKVRLSNFTRVGALMLNTGENLLSSADIDSAAGFVYFGTDTSPGIVVKVRLSDFTRVGALTLSSGENLIASAVIDSAAGFAYFGTDTFPGRVVKVRLSDFTRVGSLTLNTGEDSLGSAVIDVANGFAYFGTDTSPGIVVKVRLSDFTRVGALTLNTGENLLSSADIDSAGGFAYFGTDTKPGIVVKVRLSDFTRVGALTLNRGENHLSVAVTDTINRYAYFGTDLTSPALVVKVRLSDFTRVEALTFNSGEDDIGSAVIDAANRFAYYGTATLPGIVVKVSLPPPLVATVSCPDSGLTAGKPFTCTVSATGGTAPYTGTGAQQASFPAKGTYTVSFPVTDSNGVTASGSDTVVIAAQPLVATVACPDNGLTAGKPFTCDVSASGGTAPYTGTGSLPASFAVKGTYTVTFSVTDSNGLAASGSDTVTIGSQQLVVSVDCPNAGLTAGKPFNCTVSATGGTAPYQGTGTFSVTLPVKGTYTVSFNVTDANGTSASGSDTVVIAPQPLIITSLIASSSPWSVPIPGEPVTFSATASGGTVPYVFTWDLTGDGVADAQGNSVQWTYATAQTFTVSVSARDANSVTSQTFSRTVTVFSLNTLFRFDWADQGNNGIVDIVDIASAAICFNHTSNSADWASCSYWDINLDSMITIVDIAFAAVSFGMTIPAPYPGQGQAVGVIDPSWGSNCSSLGTTEQAYCLSRFN